MTWLPQPSFRLQNGKAGPLAMSLHFPLPDHMLMDQTGVGESRSEKRTPHARSGQRPRKEEPRGNTWGKMHLHDGEFKVQEAVMPIMHQCTKTKSPITPGSEVIEVALPSEDLGAVSEMTGFHPSHLACPPSPPMSTRYSSFLSRKPRSPSLSHYSCVWT